MAATKEDIEATAPDPEEDDLDDLDDVLDEFQPNAATSAAAAHPKSAAASSAAPGSSGPGRPAAAAAADVVPEELESQLQAGMADLISQLGENPDMQKQFEAMMQELVAAGAAPTDAAAAEHIKHASAAAPGADQPAAGSQAQPRSSKKEDSFQDTIRRTMERMQQSGDAATAATSSAGGAGAGLSEDELLQQMMKELGVGGEGGSEDFNQMLLSMMTQLTNKDILYEPMKELHDKFPAWLEKNGASTPAEERQRYEEQSRLVTEIVQRFERKGYSDDNDDDREYIVERMQKMQAAGSPPPDLVGDMSAAQEALGDLDSGCPTQ